MWICRDLHKWLTGELDEKVDLSRCKYKIFYGKRRPWNKSLWKKEGLFLWDNQSYKYLELDPKEFEKLFGLDLEPGTRIEIKSLCIEPIIPE